MSSRSEPAGSAALMPNWRLDRPAGTPRAYALFAHSEDVTTAARIARALTAQGIAVLRSDFPDIADLVGAAGVLREHYTAPALLIGHARGGAAVLAARQLIPEVRAVATFAAPAGPANAGWLIDDGRTQAERIAGLRAALLILHSPGDELVAVDNARQIFDAARHPKSFVALDGADHFLTDPADAEFAATMLGGWAARYAFGPRPEQPAPGLVVVAENGEGRFGQNIAAGRHVLVADEPAPLGHDSGPGPYDLVLAGLGACTSMTVRMYAERKQWPLDNVTVELRHARMHAEDCAECETKAGRLDRVERIVRLTGDLDDEQRRRLLEIADKCPVHRTLRSEVHIVTTEAGASGSAG